MSRNVFFYLLFTCFLLSGSPLIAAKSRAHITGGYGAIAWHPPSGSYGYAVDRANARLASEQALTQCAHTACEVVLDLHHNCGALATNQRDHHAATGATPQEAQTRALRLCGNHCRLVVWACTH